MTPGARGIAWWLVVLASGTLLAQDGPPARLAPDDFAFGVRVEPAGDGSVLDLAVPDDVYRSVVRSDLGDLRIFDAAGAIVPHALQHATVSAARRREPSTLPVFPVRAPGGDPGRVRIVTNDQGAIIEAVGAGAGGGAPAGLRVSSYLIDLGAGATRPERLELEWTQQPERGFTATVAVAVSHDLSDWRTVMPAVPVADLRAEDARLITRTITLPPVSERYLRIVWPEALQDVRLTAVQVISAPVTQPLERRMRTVSGALETDEDGAPAYVFDTDGAWPVDRVRVVFEDRNRVLDARLLSRAAVDGQWRVRHTGTFYRLERGGADVSSDYVLFSPNADRYWKLEPTVSQALTGGIPRLEIGWVPHRLVFVRQGEPPFTVAFGGAGIDPPGPASERLLAVVERASGTSGPPGDLVSPARASEVFALGGAARLDPPPPPLPWRTWVLWAVLAAGVALLAWMVWRLSRQMTPPA